MKYAVFLNGEYPQFTKKHFSLLEDRIIICADGGANFTYNNNIIPNAIVGDLDSIKDNVRKYYEEKKVIIKEYIKEKDYTDFQIALMYICNIEVDMKNRFLKEEIDFYQNKDVLVFGATGKRIDMSLSNIKMLEHNQNMKIITHSNDLMYNIKETKIINNEKGKRISIIPNSDIKGLKLEGFVYNLFKRDIKKSQALVSNIVKDDKAIISFEDGDILVCIEI